MALTSSWLSAASSALARTTLISATDPIEKIKAIPSETCSCTVRVLFTFESDERKSTARSTRSRHSPTKDRSNHTGAYAAVRTTPLATSPQGEKDQSRHERTLWISRP